MTLRTPTVSSLLLALVVFAGCASDSARTTERQTMTTEAGRAAQDEPPCDSEGMQLGKGQYRAVQLHDVVVIRATGDKPTPTHDVCLVRSPLTIFPPQYSLMWKSTGHGPEVETPYSTSAWFPAKERVERVIVSDRDGRHEVAVELVRDRGGEGGRPRRDAAGRRFIVIALIDGGGCKIVPEGSIYPMIYTQVFGPDTRAKCVEYVSKNCGNE